MRLDWQSLGESTLQNSPTGIIASRAVMICTVQT